LKVAVSMRVVDAPGYAELRDALSHDWVRLLDRLGLVPLLVPNQLQDPKRFIEETGAELCLLTNGEDVAPPGEPGPRERTESALLDLAIERRMPVLGVCRGLQLVNVYFGGAVVTDLTQSCSGAGDHVLPAGHDVELVDPALRELLGATTMVVNSYHRHGVTVGSLAPPLVAFALAAGGVVEGLYHPDHPLLAIQWHPERPDPSTERSERLLRGWIDSTGSAGSLPPWRR
jgi:gamma-glutamyl-gamma-aminobutyrate hydrolase PuuD